jgi:hypothetical protein
MMAVTPVVAAEPPRVEPATNERSGDECADLGDLTAVTPSVRAEDAMRGDYTLEPEPSLDQFWYQGLNQPMLLDHLYREFPCTYAGLRYDWDRGVVLIYIVGHDVARVPTSLPGVDLPFEVRPAVASERTLIQAHVAVLDAIGAHIEPTGSDIGYVVGIDPAGSLSVERWGPRDLDIENAMAETLRLIDPGLRLEIVEGEGRPPQRALGTTNARPMWHVQVTPEEGGLFRRVDLPGPVDKACTSGPQFVSSAYGPFGSIAGHCTVVGFGIFGTGSGSYINTTALDSLEWTYWIDVAWYSIAGSSYTGRTRVSSISYYETDYGWGSGGPPVNSQVCWVEIAGTACATYREQWAGFYGCDDLWGCYSNAFMARADSGSIPSSGTSGSTAWTPLIYNVTAVVGNLVGDSGGSVFFSHVNMINNAYGSYLVTSI